jgi:hypothetical protein
MYDATHHPIILNKKEKPGPSQYTLHAAAALKPHILTAIASFNKGLNRNAAK